MSHSFATASIASDEQEGIEFAQDEAVAPGMSRVVEIMIAGVALLFSTPLLLLAGLAVRLSSRGPIIFRQIRVGQKGRSFVLYKFRTMTVTRENAGITAADDARVLPVGRLLRRTKLDELPELWNVVKGDMSLVGPRPELPDYVDLSSPAWKLVLAARPGITDPVTISLRNEELLLAQVEGNRDEFYRRHLQPMKLNGYIAYLKKRTFGSDVKVLFHTFRAVLMPRTVAPPIIEV